MSRHVKAWRLPIAAGLGVLFTAMLFLVADSSAIQARIDRVIETSSSVAAPFAILHTGLDPNAGSYAPVRFTDELPREP
jgi:hypothetical protein